MRMLSGSSWKNADYWTEVGWSADVCVKLWLQWVTYWFVFDVDSVYCTLFLCISDRICSLLHTCSVCFVIIKTVLLSLQATHFCWHEGYRYPFFFSEFGNNITHFQNELKETLWMITSFPCSWVYFVTWSLCSRWVVAVAKLNRLWCSREANVPAVVKRTGLYPLFSKLRVNQSLSASVTQHRHAAAADAAPATNSPGHIDLLSFFVLRFSFILAAISTTASFSLSFPLMNGDDQFLDSVLKYVND